MPADALVPVRFAVLGAANIARRRMLPAMCRTAEVTPVVIASRRPDGAAELAQRFGIATAPGYARAVHHHGVDAVYIPLPNSLHAEWAERAVKAGRHVLVEKPLAVDHATARRLQRLARSCGVVLMESMMFVHHRQHAEVRRLIRAGRIGRPRAFSAAFTVPARPGGDIRYQAALGGGALLDAGVYPIRAAQFLFGHGLEVVSAVLQYDAARDVDLGGSALLVTRDGVTVQLEFGFDRAYRCRYEVCGTEGRIVLDQAFTPSADHHPMVHCTCADGRAVTLPLPADDQFANLLRYFAGAVRDGDRSGHAEASLAQAKLVDRIRNAARGVLV